VASADGACSGLDVCHSRCPCFCKGTTSRITFDCCGRFNGSSSGRGGNLMTEAAELQSRVLFTAVGLTVLVSTGHFENGACRRRARCPPKNRYLRCNFCLCRVKGISRPSFRRRATSHCVTRWCHRIDRADPAPAGKSRWRFASGVDSVFTGARRPCHAAWLWVTYAEHAERACCEQHYPTRQPPRRSPRRDLGTLDSAHRP
jgi:hypothetical protein